jgi:3-deoxy-manno-octulosonate cytidylyltransferase (CMP-KDO synthetase)
MCGKPMIRHVWERARAARLVDEVIIAVDDERVRAAVEGFGGKALMTSPDCPSGSDRLLEIAEKIPARVYVNIQGDEPLLRPEAVDTLVQSLAGKTGEWAATLCYRISAESARDPNLVKVARSLSGAALYFSRSVIPYARDGAAADYFGHCGIYAYTEAALKRFGSLPPSPLEQAEKLEQLRLLQAGIPVMVLETEPFGPAVDTPADLDMVRRILSER